MQTLPTRNHSVPVGDRIKLYTSELATVQEGCAQRLCISFDIKLLPSIILHKAILRI